MNDSKPGQPYRMEPIPPGEPDDFGRPHRTGDIRAPRTPEPQRLRELARIPKAGLADMHKANGGLMPLADYRRWSRDELTRAIMEDEGYWPR